jgi:hypothetical protein
MSHFPRNPLGWARLPEPTEPAGADPLADLLDALHQPGLDDELAGEVRSVARIAAAVRAAGVVDHRRRGKSMGSRRLRRTLSAAFAGAVLITMSGLAYAGELPAPAQGVASDVLDKVGVTLPASHDSSAADAGAAAADDPADDTTGTEDTGGTSGDTGDTTDTGDTSGTGDESSDSGDHGKGKTISQLAHDTPAPGKGKVIAPVASGGKSHAGNPPGQDKKGENGGSSHKPDHPDHPTKGGGNGHEHGGSGDHGNGS